VKALLNHSDGDVTAIYARWHMFDEKLEAVMAIETPVFPRALTNWPKVGRDLVGSDLKLQNAARR
jgi:hypothetical protein